MTLSPDTARCLGLLPGLTSEVRCSKREQCARFTQRTAGKYMAQWLCPTPDEWYGAFIPARSAA